MATLLTHAAVGLAVGQAASPELRRRTAYWSAVILGSILPDFDVIGFYFGVRYPDLWGHRGITHSLLFAAIVAAGMAVFLRCEAKDRWKLASILFVITASHGVLDALTNGGLGVAFFSPFDRRRYFFPWRPIQVSPIGVRGFSSRGVQVLEQELWILVPTMAALGIVWVSRACRRIRQEGRAEVPGQPT